MQSKAAAAEAEASKAKSEAAQAQAEVHDLGSRLVATSRQLAEAEAAATQARDAEQLAIQQVQQALLELQLKASEMDGVRAEARAEVAKAEARAEASARDAAVALANAAAAEAARAGAEGVQEEVEAALSRALDEGLVSACAGSRRVFCGLILCCSAIAAAGSFHHV